MCGLNCIISKSGKPIRTDSLKEMNDLILHRGPDDEGYFTNNWVGLGFRRLSIIDLSSAAHQPISDATGRYVCVFNGEIYNYLELREVLKQKGCVFKSNSDTEVLLNAYITWGKDCLEKFIGMFSFIILDLKRQSVFIARDPLGIKPLYYTEDQDFYYFSSEIKAFKAIKKLNVDPNTYFEQFIFRYVSGERTGFSGVKKVLPGHYHIYLNNRMTRYQYYNLKDTFRNKSNLLSTEEIEKSLEESAILHTRSDVGYALQLSGGVDSSYLATIISKINSSLATYSIALDDSEFDESEYQKLVVEKHKTSHHSLQLSGQDYYENLEKATYHMDMPIIHGGCIFLMLLCREIAKKTKVVLTGEGADELFAGYQRYMPTMSHKMGSIARCLHVPTKFIPGLWKLKGLKHFISDDLVYYSQKYNEPEVYQNLFIKEHRPKSKSYRKQLSGFFSFSYLDSVLYYDQNTYLSSLLDRQDRMSMAASIEARVPYCNSKLFSFINPIHSKFKIQEGRAKTLLKNCASKMYSDTFLNRKKNGLLLPYDTWFKQYKKFSEYFLLLTDRVAKDRGIYNQRNIMIAVDKFSKGEYRFLKPLLSLVHIEVWHRIFDL